MTDKSQDHDEAPESDLSTLPFLNDAEHAEHEWLIARETDPDAPPPSSKTAAEYEHLEGMLSSLPEPALSERWHTALLERTRASRTAPTSSPRAGRRRTAVRWGLVTTGLAAAAALVLVLYARPDHLPDTLASESFYTIRSVGDQRGATGSGVRRGASSALIGDHVLSDPLRPGRDEFRVYHLGVNQALVAKCPGGAGCIKDASGEHIDFKLDAAGSYRLIVVEDAQGSLGAAPDALDDFLAAVGHAHAVSQWEEITVE